MLLPQALFSVPSLPYSHLSRNILRADQAKFDAAQIVVLEAASGYGKTALLADYFATASVLVIWVPLEYLGNTDLITFVQNLLRAVETVDAASKAQFAASLEELLKINDTAKIEATLVQWLLPTLLARIACWEKPTALVLENIHTLVNGTIDDFLLRLCELAPPTLRLFVTSRQRIEWQWRQAWEASGRLLTINQQQMVLTAIEAQKLAWMMDRTLSAQSVLELHEATQGWPLLFMLACREHASHPTALHPSVNISTQQQMSRYLEELLLAEAPSQQDFLLRTAILDDLTPTRCDFLLQSATSWQRLNQLGNHIFLRVQWSNGELHYRHAHTLIQNFLQTQLEQRFVPSEVALLYTRLGDLYEKGNEWEQALRCYVRADNRTAAESLIEGKLFYLLDSVQFRRLEQWLAMMPSAWLAESNGLKLCQGVLWARQENPRAISLLQNVIESSPPTSAPERYALAVGELSYLYHMQNNYRLGHQWLEKLEIDTLPQRLQAHLLHRYGLALIGIDDFDHAFSVLDQALKRRLPLNTVEDELVANSLMRLQAITHAYRGFLQPAIKLLRQASQRVQSVPNHHFYLAWTLNNLVAQYRMTGEFELAHRTLDQAMQLIESYRPVLPNHRLFAYLEVNRAHLYCDVYDDPQLEAWIERQLRPDALIHRGVWEEALFDYYFAHPQFHSKGFDLAQAVWQHERESGSPNALTRICGTLGLAYLVNGKPQRAYELMQEALAVWEAHSPGTFGATQMYVMLYFSAAHFQLGKEAHALQLLQRSLEWMRERGYYNLEVWVPQIMAQLCYQALIHEIEADYVESLVSKRFRTRYYEPFFALLLHHNPPIRQRGERILRHVAPPDWQQAYQLLQQCKEPATQQRLLTWLSEGWLTPFGLLYLRQLFSWRELETFLLWIHPALQAETETIAHTMQLSPDTVKSYLKSVKQTLRTHFALAVEGRGAQMPAFDWAIKRGVVDARR